MLPVGQRQMAPNSPQMQGRVLGFKTYNGWTHGGVVEPSWWVCAPSVLRPFPISLDWVVSQVQVHTVQKKSS